MLNATLGRGKTARHNQPSEQRGIVLVLALVVLAAMTLAGIGLMRSVFTSNRVAGNLAFQQAAVHSADAGIEAAVAWLEDRNANSVETLYDSRLPGGANLGYFASRPRDTDPVAGQSWEPVWALWRATGRFNTLPADAAGNTVEFVIHRLCNGIGAPDSGIGCEASPTVVGSEGGSRGSGVVGLVTPSQRYYRITVRVAGPRNTVSFVQSIVAL